MAISPMSEANSEIDPEWELSVDIAQIIDTAITDDEPHSVFEIADIIVETAKQSRLFGGEGKDRREFWTNLDADD